jgi:hypothetical protein
MRTTRTLIISLLAAFAVSAVAAGTASAASPELYFQVGGAKITKAYAFSDTSGVSKLYSSLEKGATPIVIECASDTSAGLLLTGGLTSNVATFETCKFVAPTPAAIIEKCTVTSVQSWARDSLEYGGGTSEIVDVFEPPPGSTVFAVVTIAGSKCSIAGKYNVTGSVIARIKTERTEAKTGEAIFATVEGKGKVQEPKEYEETKKERKRSTCWNFRKNRPRSKAKTQSNWSAKKTGARTDSSN